MTNPYLAFDNVFARLPPYFYTKQPGEGFAQPVLLHFNPKAAALIDLTPEAASDPVFPFYFSGTMQLQGAEPLAMVYAGHQFGVYVPRLGDGRALLLGQVRNHQGELWDIHLKGSGTTPYSRGADGRAVVRSCIREYLCSEAMHALDIPTSRALCIVGTNEQVMREKPEPGAVLTRLARSHIRFGHFEYFHYTGQYQTVAELAEHVINEYFPVLSGEPDRHMRWLEAVIISTAQLMAQWQAAGFAHGVMNTDNMSILGHTIDYGPFGFMEKFEPGFICNHSDAGGRYAFNRQPSIGLWNLHALTHALSSLVPLETSELLLEQYGAQFTETYLALMRRKLGVTAAQADDIDLLKDLLALLQAQGVDYTLFFRALSRYRLDEASQELSRFFDDLDAWSAWERRYAARLVLERSDDDVRSRQMLRVNPKYILRNWVAEQAIRRAEDHQDYSEITRVLRVMQAPYDEHSEDEDLAAPAPEWARELSVSCSS